MYIGEIYICFNSDRLYNEVRQKMGKYNSNCVLYVLNLKTFFKKSKLCRQIYLIVIYYNAD